jgi:hypothetical protein
MALLFGLVCTGVIAGLLAGVCCWPGAGDAGVVEAGNAGVGVNVVAFFSWPELEQAARTKARRAEANNLFMMTHWMK